MFSGLRLRLTALYFLVGLAFLVLVGAGTTGLLRAYYRQSTDLALQHRLAQELRAVGADVPAELAAADAAWYAGRGRPTPVWVPSEAPAPVAAGTAEGTGDDSGGDDGGDDSGDESAGNSGDHDGGDDSGDESAGNSGDHGDGDDDEAEDAGSSSHAAEEAREHEEAEHQALEAYDAELAAIYLLRLDAAGQAITGTGAGTAQPAADVAAVARAIEQGVDWRTGSTPSGGSIRLLTYALPGATAGPVLQLGRPLADQERVLRRLMAVMLGLGLLAALLLGAGGWWLAGRSLRPAEAAWRQQQSFVANASHELRTPLTLIRASAEVLARGLPSTGGDRALVGDILAETDHMSQLVSDLLVLSRLDSGELPLRPESVPLEPLAADLARQFGRLAEARGVHFVAEVLPVAALADPTRLRQVLVALLDNALRHTPAGGTINLAAAPAGAGVAIEVIDTGAGIPPEHRPHVFERFYRGSPGNRETGAGLGLALAKALVEAQGGRITLDSAPGRGTRVTVTLPAAPRDAGARVG